MIDWVTCKIPFYAPPDKLITGGTFLSIDANGTIEHETNKAMQITGSFESTIRIRTFAIENDSTTTEIQLSGNPVKFLQGHNVFGSSDLPNLVYSAALKISEMLGIVQPNYILNAWKNGLGTLSRVDVNYMYDLQTRDNAMSYLYHIGKHSRTRAGTAISRGTTVYHNQTSKRWSFKHYSKAQEIELPRNTKQGMIELPMQLIQWVQPMLRAELTLKSNELRCQQSNGLHLIKNWVNQDISKVFGDYYERITMPDQIELEPIDLEKLGNAKSTYLLWKEGHDLKSIISIRTYYRHRKLILPHGIDISSPPPKTQPDRSNVVPFVRTITLKPAVIPTEFLNSDLFYQPLRIVT